MEIGVTSSINQSLQPRAFSPENQERGRASTDSENEPLEDPSSAESRELRQLQERDREVRAHEQAHKAAGGRYIISGASFQYEQGPDGRNYAVGGEVSIDTAPVSGDPQATLAKMETVRRAALAPADPSPQDRAVASQAAQEAAKARQEIAQERLSGEEAVNRYQANANEEDSETE